MGKNKMGKMGITKKQTWCNNKSKYDENHLLLQMQSFEKLFNTFLRLQSVYLALCRCDSRRGSSSMCDLRARAPMPHQRQRVQGRLARSQWWHYQFWQLPVRHADSVSVYHHGGLDRRAVLGEFSRSAFPVQRYGTVTNLQLKCLLRSDTQQ